VQELPAGQRHALYEVELEDRIESRFFEKDGIVRAVFIDVDEQVNEDIVVVVGDDVAGLEPRGAVGIGIGREAERDRTSNGGRARNRRDGERHEAHLISPCARTAEGR
jgi:hypothetical protein